AERARLLEIRDVTAVQDVEHAVGHHARPRERGDPRERVAGAADLRRKARLGDHFGAGGGSDVCGGSGGAAMYSNSVTTRTTPLVVLATRAAAAPSLRVTMPIR